MVPEAPAQRPRILVVEDDSETLTLLGRLLGTLGDVVVATDGQSALAMLHRGPLPALVVTDVMMPRLDGLTLVKRMREDPRTKGIPVIVLTALHRPGDVIAGINAGARHYVTKPFRSEELLDKARRALALG